MTDIGLPQKEIICDPLEDPVPREVPLSPPEDPEYEPSLPDRELTPA